MGLLIHVRGKLIRVAAHAAQKDEYLALVRLSTHDRVNISCNARFKPHNLVGSLVSSPAGKDVTRNLTSKVSLLFTRITWATSVIPAYCFGRPLYEYVVSLADLTALGVYS